MDKEYPQLEALASVIWQQIDGTLNQETMAKLSPNQITLIAYDIMRKELLEGGFVQLIQNGYGPFIFLNPFAKAMRLWGLDDFSKWIYKARKIYENTASQLEQPTETDDDFMALYEQYPQWDEFDDFFIDQEPLWTQQVCSAYLKATTTPHNDRD